MGPVARCETCEGFKTGPLFPKKSNHNAKDVCNVRPRVTGVTLSDIDTTVTFCRKASRPSIEMLLGHVINDCVSRLERIGCDGMKVITFCHVMFITNVDITHTFIVAAR